jgi:hypothetical protein
LVARQLGAATRFPGWLSYKAYGQGRAMLAPAGVFRQSVKKDNSIKQFKITSCKITS